MKEKNIAKVYASALIELSEDAGVDTAKELTSLTEVVNSSNELENLLFLDVFSTEEKIDVFESIAEKLGISNILKSTINYLIAEKRIGLLPLIYKEVIVFDDHKKGFIRGEVFGASETLSEADKKSLIEKISTYVKDKEVVLNYKKTDSVTAGYKVIVDDLQLDATVDYQLEKFKKSIVSE